jgi:hypothetical protein
VGHAPNISPSVMSEEAFAPRVGAFFAMGLRRHPWQRVEVCGGGCNGLDYFLLVITPCNCFSEFEPSRRLCEPSCRFLDSRAAQWGAYISPLSRGAMCTHLIFSPPLRTKLSLFGFSLGFSFARSLPLGL